MKSAFPTRQLCKEDWELPVKLRAETDLRARCLEASRDDKGLQRNMQGWGKQEVWKWMQMRGRRENTKRTARKSPLVAGPWLNPGHCRHSLPKRYRENKIPPYHAAVTPLCLILHLPEGEPSSSQAQETAGEDPWNPAPTGLMLEFPTGICFLREAFLGSKAKCK